MNGIIQMAGVFTASLVTAVSSLAVRSLHSDATLGTPDGDGLASARRLMDVDVFGNISIPSAKLRSLIPFDDGETVTLNRVLAVLQPQERETVTGQSGISEEARFDVALSLLSNRIEREALTIDPVGFAQLRWEANGNRTFTLILDVAERGDPGLSGLRPAPEEIVPVPDKLNTLWQQYRKVFFDRLLAGRPLKEIMESGHWRTLDPVTRRLEDELSAVVRDHLSEVAAAALRHQDPQVRQMSAYALTWSPDPRIAVRTLLEAIRDPVPFVRNEAARALIPLAALSIDSHAVEVPIEPIVDLLNRPTSTDRNKAAGILTELAADPSKRPTIQRLAAHRLDAMAASRAPLNRDVAIPLLRLLRG